MILPRTATRRFRPTAAYYRFLGLFKARLLHPLRATALRDTLLAAFGPASVILLVILWSSCLIYSFAFIEWGLQVHLQGVKIVSFSDYLYFSGTCFFTLGLGDLTPGPGAGRLLSVIEAGLGFGLLAAVIGYLPTLYQSFSQRESFIVRIQQRCGGVIDGYSLLGHFLRHGDHEGLAMELRSFEEWAATLIETTESYPMLAFYRSQNSARSWVGLLAAGMDACAALQLPCDPPWPPRLRSQADASFDLGRHALNSLSARFHREPNPKDRRSLDMEKLRRCLGDNACPTGDDESNEKALWELAALYEPQAIELARFLALELP